MYRLFLAGIACLVVTIAGCTGGEGKGRPDLFPVSGTVVYNGAPVEGATVSFNIENAPRTATGVTDAKGKFVLSTFEYNDGAIAGKHTITVTKMEAGAAAPSTSAADKLLNDPTALAQMSQIGSPGGAPEQAGPKILLPEKYMNPATTPLSETVVAGQENVFLLQLAD